MFLARPQPFQNVNQTLLKPRHIRQSKFVVQKCFLLEKAFDEDSGKQGVYSQVGQVWWRAKLGSQQKRNQSSKGWKQTGKNSKWLDWHGAEAKGQIRMLGSWRGTLFTENILACHSKKSVGVSLKTNDDWIHFSCVSLRALCMLTDGHTPMASWDTLIDQIHHWCY